MRGKGSNESRNLFDNTHHNCAENYPKLFNGCTNVGVSSTRAPYLEDPGFKSVPNLGSSDYGFHGFSNSLLANPGIVL
jgi:hypothetical protein